MQPGTGKRQTVILGFSKAGTVLGDGTGSRVGSCAWRAGPGQRAQDLSVPVRETREETGIDCEVTGLVGIYTDPRHVILYTSNREARQEFSIVLTARATGG